MIVKISGIHPVASIFPLLEGPEFDALVKDIRANGLRESIWVDDHGLVVDGRNRLRACEILGTTPPYRQLPAGTDVLAFVVSVNLHRRHLDASQRAAIAAELQPQLKAEAKKRMDSTRKKGTKPAMEKVPEREKGVASEQAGKLLKVNRKYVDGAIKLKKENPELFNQVKNGKVTLRKAQAAVKEKKAKKDPLDPALATAANASKNAKPLPRLPSSMCIAAIEAAMEEYWPQLSKDDKRRIIGILKEIAWAYEMRI